MQQQTTNPCPSSQPGAQPPSNANDSSDGLKNWDSSKSPPGSVTVTAPNGNTFPAPPYANFQAAYNSGVQDARLLWPADWFAFHSDFGHWGTYDYQRVGSTFISAYVPAANYAVGIGMQGAGFTRSGMVPFINHFITVRQTAEYWMLQGWDAAASGACGKPKS